MQSTAVVALALLESVQAFQAPVMRSRTVQMFSEGDLGVLPPLGVYDPLGLIETRDMRRYEIMEIKHGRAAMLGFLHVIALHAGIYVPGYLSNLDAIKAKNVDEIWCLAANDGFVMAAWGESEKGLGKIRFLGDGSAHFAKALGLELDLTTKGMGMRMQRFSMLVDDGVVKTLNVEGPGKFEVSNAETMLSQLG